jgi:ABC-type glycerol-3-phosphate transport system substrate-binding protein
MARSVVLSTMSHSAEGSSSIQTDMEQFGKMNGMDITCQEFDYVTGWSDFMRMSIYGGSPDVSEIGTTWIQDFAAMNVLRPFSASEIRNVGGKETFVPATWQSGMSMGAVWAIPWMTDLSMVCYRRDMLAQAGIQEQDAFQTPEKFEQTLKQLQETGISAPWVVPTQRSYINVHNLAMWVWQAGQDLLDTEKKIVLLDQPGVRSAILSFFSLYRFISKEMQFLPEREADQMFIEGKAAVTISGPWNIISSLRNPAVAANMGLAIPLGCSYTGGASLIVWERTNQSQAALELIAHLASREFQTTFPKMVGLLPGRLDSLESFPLPDPSLYPVVYQALKTGRSLPNVGLWGLIEDRLAHAIPLLWDGIFASPDPDLEALYDKHISPLTNRLNITLSQS